MPEEIAVIVVAGLVFTFMVIRTTIRHEERKLALKAEGAAPAHLEQVVASMQTEMTRLRDRVNVLEKLVTDDDRRLAEEISRLKSIETARV